MSAAPCPDCFTSDHYAYIIGYPDGMVRPQDNITRAEVATIFFRLLSEETRAELVKIVASFDEKGADSDNPFETTGRRSISLWPPRMAGSTAMRIRPSSPTSTSPGQRPWRW